MRRTLMFALACFWISSGTALAAPVADQAARETARQFVRGGVKQAIQTIRLPRDGQGILLFYYLPVVVLGSLAFSAACMVVLRREVLAGARTRGENSGPREAAPDRPSATADTIFLIRFRNGVRLVKASEIEAVRAADDYCELVLQGGERLLHDASLTAISGRLPAGFCRIHRSAIINTACLAAVRRRAKGGHETVTRSGEVLPIGRTYLGAVRRLLR